MSVSVVRSEWFRGNSVAGIAEQMADWMAENVPDVTEIYRGNSGGAFTRALFTWRGQPVGIDLTWEKENLKLRACYQVYITKTGAPHATPVTDYSKNATSIKEGDYSVPCGRITENRVTEYIMALWYAETEQNGLLVGMFSDDDMAVYQKYPVYLGEADNEYTGEHMAYTVQLNRGAYPVAGMSSNKAKLTGHSTGTNGEGSTSPNNLGMATGYAVTASGSPHRILLQHLHSYVAKSNYLNPHHLIYYSPLWATFPASTCQAFQVDNFFAGSFSPQTHPPLLERIAPDGNVYLTVSDDGVALRLPDESPSTVGGGCC